MAHEPEQAVPARAIQLGERVILAESIADITGLLTGGGVTLTGALLYAIWAFATGKVHADKTVQKRNADYEAQLEDERERCKEANARADKWEQKAWDSFQTSKQAVEVAKGTIDTATRKASP